MKILETSVGQLLGSAIEKDTDIDLVAEQLARINEQLVIKNRRSHRIWKTISIIFIAIIIVNLILVILSVTAFSAYRVNTDVHIEEYTEEIIED